MEFLENNTFPLVKKIPTDYLNSFSEIKRWKLEFQGIISEKRIPTVTGLEPAIFGSEVRRLIH